MLLNSLFWKGLAQKTSKMSGMYFILAAMVINFGFPDKSEAAIVFSDPDFVAEPIATLGTYSPVGVAFDTNGRIFAWRKEGVVRIIKNGVLLPAPFIDIQAQVNRCSDRGLLGLAVDPNFSTNGYVYLLYAVEQGGVPSSCGAKISRLTRVTADPSNLDIALPGSEITILDNIQSTSDVHSVGSLHFAPDGKLFVTHGDGADASVADILALRSQNLDSYNGKILRINPDGTGPSDNPFYDGNSASVRSKVWAYGLRNPFRFALHPDTSEPYIGDVGWGTWEEINKGRGKNFGWPCYEGNNPQPTYQNAFPTQCGLVPASSVTLPVYSYGRTLGTSVTGGSFYTGLQYPAQYRGNLFFADYNFKWIKRMVLDASGNMASIIPFATGVEGPVDIQMGPDGMLYYVAFITGEIGRIRYTAANQAPIAQVTATPRVGYSPLTVNFSSAGSLDISGGSLTYFWEFGDGATASAANPQHIYTNTGVVNYLAKLTVTNSAAMSASAETTITVGSVPPVATILSPANGTGVVPGDTVTYQGSAFDDDDGVLPSTALSWQVLLHHNDHVHIFQTATGTGGSFLVTSHGSGNFSYEIILTATDSSGLTNTKSISLPMPSVGSPDVVAAYNLNEGLGNVISDSSGNDNNGSINNVTWTTQGKFSNALFFDSLTPFASVPNSATLGLGNEGTTEAWVKLSTLNRWHTVVAKGNADLASAHNYAMQISDLNRAFCVLGNGVTNQYLFSPTSLDTQFHHLACTWNGTTLSLYIDGVLNASAAQTVTAAANTAPLYLGRYGGVTDEFKGTIDEVRIYKRALSQSEIQFDMNSPILSTPNTAPTISSMTSLTVDEDTATAAISFSIDDAETVAGSLTVTGSSSNTALVPNANIVFGGSGANRTVTVTPALNQNGAATITVNVSDGLATTPSAFLLTVNAVNDAPTVTSIANQSTMTGVAIGPINFTVGDPDTAAGSLVVSASSSNQALVPDANIVIGGSGASRTLTVTPVANMTGIATVTVTANDGQFSTPMSFLLTVSTAPSGLMAAYPFSEGIGLTTLDASGNGNTGTLVNGPVWTTGRYGNGLLFNATIPIVSVPNSATLGLGNAGTAEAWVKLNTLNRWHTLIAKGNADLGSAHNYAMQISDLNRAFCVIGNGAASQYLFSPTTMDTQFHHLACTWNGTTLSLYIDGILNASSAQTVTAAVNTAPLYLGRYGGVTDELKGILDEVRIYNRALSLAEIQTDMNSPVIAPTPNVAPVASAVNITGVVEVTRTLTGNYTYSDANGDLQGVSTFRWLRNGAPISGATASTYVLVGADQGAMISFEVTPVAQTGASPGVAVASAQVGPVTAPLDSDGDTVPDYMDNCTLVSNTNQRDTDGDNYGNMCDGDFTNDGNTNTLDLNILKAAYRSNVGDANYNQHVDLNGDGTINTLDLNIFKVLYRKAPGPSGLVLP